jgi:hypothetical protein
VLARPTRDLDLAAKELPAPLRLPLTHVACRRGVPTRRGDLQLLSKPLVSSCSCFRPHGHFLSLRPSPLRSELSHASTGSTMSLNGNRWTKWSDKHHLAFSKNLISNLLKFPLN